MPGATVDVTRPPLLPAPTVERRDAIDAFDTEAVAWARKVRDELLVCFRDETLSPNERAKLADVALKFERYGSERHDKAAGKQTLEAMIEHEREMAGLGRRAH